MKGREGKAKEEREGTGGGENIREGNSSAGKADRLASTMDTGREHRKMGYEYTIIPRVRGVWQGEQGNALTARYKSLTPRK